MTAAWWSWSVAGRSLLPRLRICFAAGAGLAPVHHERFTVRGGGNPPPIDRLSFVETSSYGPRGLDALIRVLGIDVVVNGTDKPYASTSELRLGDAADRAVGWSTPEGCLANPDRADRISRCHGNVSATRQQSLDSIQLCSQCGDVGLVRALVGRLEGAHHWPPGSRTPVATSETSSPFCRRMAWSNSSSRMPSLRSEALTALPSAMTSSAFLQEDPDRRVPEGEPVHQGVEPNRVVPPIARRSNESSLPMMAFCTTFDSRNITTKSMVFKSTIERCRSSGRSPGSAHRPHSLHGPFPFQQRDLVDEQVVPHDASTMTLSPGRPRRARTARRAGDAPSLRPPLGKDPPGLDVRRRGRAVQ